MKILRLCYYIIFVNNQLFGGLLMLEHVLKAIKDKFSISSDREVRRMFDNTIDEIRDNPMDAELIVEENLKMDLKLFYELIEKK